MTITRDDIETAEQLIPSCTKPNQYFDRVRFINDLTRHFDQQHQPRPFERANLVWSAIALKDGVSPTGDEFRGLPIE